MSEEKFREWISSEFEKEAEELEKRLQEHEAADPELAALEMPEDSFDDLMRRIKAEEENKNISKNENGPAKKPFRIRKRTLLAVAAAAILVAAMGAGVTGAKLFVPKVENRKYPSPQAPKPSPGVPMICAFSKRKSKNSQLPM